MGSQPSFVKHFLRKNIESRRPFGWIGGGAGCGATWRRQGARELEAYGAYVSWKVYIHLVPRWHLECLDKAVGTGD